MNLIKLFTLSLVLLTGSISFARRSDIEKYPKVTLADRQPSSERTLFTETTPFAEALKKGIKNNEFSKHLENAISALNSTKEKPVIITCKDEQWKIRDIKQPVESNVSNFEIYNECDSNSSVYYYNVTIEGKTNSTGFDSSEVSVRFSKERID